MLSSRHLAILPTTITLGAAACGFGAIAVASRVHGGLSLEEAHTLLQISGWLIFAGWFLDGIDGRVARMTKTTSRFGMELDSLSDLVCCGVAPAMLLLKMGPAAERPVLHTAFLLAAIAYFLCTLLRLARFNIEADGQKSKPEFFKGLPCPCAAGCIAALAISRFDIHEMLMSDSKEVYQPIGALLLIGAFGLSLLMVSNVRYPRVFTRFPRNGSWLAQIAEITALVLAFVFFGEIMIAAVFWGYVLFEPVTWAARRSYDYATSLVGKT